MVTSSRAVGWPAREAHRGQAQRAVTDELDDVHRYPFVAVPAEVVRHRSPREVHAGRQGEGEAAHLLAELVGDGRGGESAIADHLGGDALADLGLGAAITPEAPVGMRVHVDEARRDGEAGGVNRPPRGLPLEIADGGDVSP